MSDRHRATTQPTWAHGPSCPVRVFRYIICTHDRSTHAGTHAGAPPHYDPDGATIDAMVLDTYIAPARLPDLRGCGPVITPGLVSQALSGPPCVLACTMDVLPHDTWPDAFVTLAAETIARLAPPVA